MADCALKRIEIAANCSLSVAGACVFFGVLCCVTFAVAGLITLMGYWPVLPFAAAEMVGVGLALKYSLARQHKQHEIITLSENDVRIESGAGAHYVEIVFPRHWAQVKLRRPASRLHPSRLTIESHGRRYEVGSFLTEQERRGLADRLARLIGRINESPSLA